jgi:putative AdoMet-dependent methyltransferase
MSADDDFNPESFDAWADSYDEDITSQDVFPFAGYQQVLDTVVRLAQAQPGMSVLDLGTGTANLALRFARLGCQLWGTDFSEPMLAKARIKLPEAHFLRYDLRDPWPADLERQFDRIVSAYVFHHFGLGEKVELCKQLVTRRLSAGGRLLVADISFPDQAAMQAFARSVGDLWEQEPYWLAGESLNALRAASLRAEYQQVSPCAGVYAFMT